MHQDVSEHDNVEFILMGRIPDTSSHGILILEITETGDYESPTTIADTSTVIESASRPQ